MPKRLLVTFGVIAAFYALNFVLSSVLVLPGFVIFLVYVVLCAIAAYVFRGQLFTMAASIMAKSGKFESAEGLYKKAYAACPNSAIINTNYGITLTREGKGEEAIPVLKRTFELKPNELVKKNNYLALGSAYWVAGDLEGAVTTFEDMRAKYDYVNSTVLTTLGFIYLMKGEFEKATETTNLALQESPNLSSAWDNLGQISYRQGNFDEAKSHFEKAIENNPKIIDSLFYLGEIHEKEGDEQKAREYFEKVSALKVRALNTVSEAQIDEKLKKFGIEYK